MAGDGSQASPWSTLEEVVASGAFGSTIEAGDRVYLGGGDHGAVQIDDGDYEPPIEIVAEEPHAPQLSRLSVGGSGLRFSGLSISPSYAASYETGTIVELREGSSRVTVEGCEVFSERDVTAWGASEWVDRASSGFGVGGDDDVVRDNVVTHVRFGISVDGERALIDHNVVDGFSADGLRGLGDYGIFQYNVVKNVYVDGDQDDNHDDGFQSWSVGPDGVGTGEVVGVVLRGNLILNYEDPNQPLRATLQGVGCFDGMFVDWVIENNVVITDHWHGITLLGARGCRIVNNTVLDVNDQDPGPPWISIDAHKDGRLPEDCVVRNNLATDYVNADSVTEDHNLTIDDPTALFVDVAAHDLRLRSDAMAAIDQGVAELAPELDADGIARPQGSGIDLGAYEWHEPGVGPVGGGGVAGSAGSGTTGSAGSTGAAAGAGAGVPGSGVGGAVGSAGSGAMPATAGSAAPADGAGASGAAGNESNAGSTDEGGCSCRLAGARGSSERGAARWGLGCALILAAARRRARVQPRTR